MKSIFILFVFMMLFAGCKPKVLSGKALEAKLIETMGNYLDTTLKPGLQATIMDVAYYTEREQGLYRCRFNVRMKFGNVDTTGIVAGTITNDFKTVSRTQ